MTHLGYWDDFGWYKIIVTINDALALITDFYYKTIRKANRYFEQELLNEIKVLKECADKELC